MKGMKGAAKIILAVAAITTLFYLASLALAGHFTGHEQLNLTRLEEDFISPNTAESTVSISLTNASRAFVIATQARHALLRYAYNIVNETVLNFSRVSVTGGSSVDISYFVVEFDSGIEVRRGVTYITNAKTATVDLVTPVNLSKSFLIVSTNSSSPRGGNKSDDWSGIVFANFTNTTMVYFSRNDTDRSIVVHWQVVEFKDNSTVQSGTTNMTGASTNIAVTINEVDLTRSFPLIYWNASATEGFEEREYLRANLTNSTILNITRRTSGGTLVISWFVITLNHTNASVQKYDVNVLSSSIEANITITSVNLSRSIIVWTAQCEDVTGNEFATDDCTAAVNFTNSTLVRARRLVSGRSGFFATFYVIEFPFNASVATPDSCTPTQGQDWTINAQDSCIVDGKDYSVGRVLITGSTGTVIFRNSNITSTDCRIEPNAGAMITLAVYPTTRWSNGC